MFKSRRFIIICLCAFLFFSTLLSFGQSAEEIGDLYKKLSWRSIGPAVMGGRTVDIDVVEKEPWIIYAAIGPSGVWKSDNNGISWSPLFQEEKTVSVGDIAIAQSHPQIIWAGTGEATCRNSVTIGDGVYKSTNSGKTWTNMGLENTRHISRIVINPGDPNIVYVAAMGHLWGPNEERGIYKTTDGGKTWRKVLYVDENTGFADLAMHPEDSLVLYAAAYEYRRLPYYFSSGGPGSALYRSTDGGETWNKLTEGLPEGIMGRIGLAVSRSKPDVVYALIEHQDGGIWRSDDRGETWTRTCDNETYERVNFRPFYYSQIRVDPSNDKVVYVFSGGTYVSYDKGAKFRVISSGTHPDHHALWIDPQNSLHLIDGNDGGIDIAYDGGRTWQSIKHMALAEAYQVGFDMRSPYYVYCGLQDNGVWGGPSATLDTGGITNCDWFMVGYGDGFYAQVDPSDYNIIYGNSQMNGLYRYDMRIKKSKTIRPTAPLQDPPYRFNWNSPILISPHDPKTVYTGGNYLFKTIDGGNSWEIISPDLSTADPEKMKDSGGPITWDNTGAEIHCTIITIAESPVKSGVIWCGTDDGNVQVTQNGGRTWENVVKNIEGLPANTWCSRIEASHFEEGTAYVAFDGHRRDDYGTYLYETTDYGKSWSSLKGNLPFGWIHVVREDLKNRYLLYVGTEFGIFASLDGGKSWFSLRNNLPTVAVRDIAVHPRDNDLIIGTHGRGIWILDDIVTLQNMSPDIFQSDHHLFSLRPVTLYELSSSGEPSSIPVFAGRNPEYSAVIFAYFKNKPEEKPKIVIKDGEGNQVQEVSLLTKEGIHRQLWNLQFVPETKDGKKIKPSGLGFLALPSVFPGEYTVEMTVNGDTSTQKLMVHPDPRLAMTREEKKSQVEAQAEVIAISKKLGLAVTAANNIQSQIGKLEEALKEKEGVPKELLDQVNAFKEKFEGVKGEVMPRRFGYRVSMETALRGGSISQQIMTLGMSIGGFPSAPTEMDWLQIRDLGDAVDLRVGLINQIILVEMPALNKILEQNGLKALKVPDKVRLE